MLGREPTVFISSTFYDLQQIRADLAKFITELGYRFLASEFQSFPVESDRTAIENCKRRVEQDADIFILLIGARYGSRVSGKKSVTNLEYETAKRRALPIFAFVKRDVLALLPVWEKNKAADFSETVDDPELFEFITQVRSADNVWTFPFDTAADVVSALRMQLAYQMTRGLELSQRLRSRNVTADLLNGEALQLTLDRPFGWAGKVFAALVEREIRSAYDAGRNYRAGLSFGAGEIVTKEVAAWIHAAVEESGRLMDGATKIIHAAVAETFLEGDVALIAYRARQVGRAYLESIEWVARLRCAFVPEQFRPAVSELSHFLDGLIDCLEELGPSLMTQINEFGATPGPPRTKFEIPLRTNNLDNIQAALMRLKTAQPAPESPEISETDTARPLQPA